jgi:DNA-binding transcriptional regulator YdaS (Cro superfamily)
MDLLSFIRTLKPEQLAQLAAGCGTSVGQIKQVAYGHRRASAQLAISIDSCTSGAVPCEALRPDIDWQYLRDSALPGARAA